MAIAGAVAGENAEQGKLDCRIEKRLTGAAIGQIETNQGELKK